MADGVPPLAAEIRQLISIAGPMPVRHFMSLCLTHAQHGYYMTRDPFGADGDFTTAPEISQMFGELIGLWVALTWRRMGSPNRFRLVEMGPGRGTMMLDAIRASRVMPEFHKALFVHLVETSPVLQRRQRQIISGLDVPVAWHESFADIPEGPAIVVANEFLDALPINQVIKKDSAWHERVVDVDADGNFVFSITPDPLAHFAGTLPPNIRDAPDGSIFEWRPNDFMLALASRLVREGGAALLIDYGHVESGTGDTFQAVRSHRFTNPLNAPGQTDLTAHVDFQALTSDAEIMGARVHGPIKQREFLQRMGIDARAQALKAVLSPEKAAEIDAAHARLTASSATGMGDLFKVIAISHPELDTLPAFDMKIDAAAAHAP